MDVHVASELWTGRFFQCISCPPRHGLKARDFSRESRSTLSNSTPFRISPSKSWASKHGGQSPTSCASAAGTAGGASWRRQWPHPCFSPWKLATSTIERVNCPGGAHQQQRGGVHPRHGISTSPSASFRSSQFYIKSSICSSAVSQDTVFDSTREDRVDQLEKFYDENECLFDDETWGRRGQDECGNSWPDWLEEKMNVSLAAGRVGRVSQVLVSGGSAAFVEQLCDASSPTLVLVTHFSLLVLSVIKEMNDDIMCWQGDVQDLPDSYGPFDSVFLNSLITISFSPVQFLQVVASLCKPGARIVISHSHGKEHLEACREKNPNLILQSLPDERGLQTMINALPLKLVEYRDESAFYLAVLEVTETSGSFIPNRLGGLQGADITPSHEKFPIRARGWIVKGFGRGSKELGIPTANIDPLDLPCEILKLAKGVYFGWAQVKADGLDGGAYKMVMNIGIRPTFKDGGLTVEVHILHYYGGVDFYGKELSVIVLGFIRNEMQFNSLGDLVRRINTDITTAEKLLDDEKMFQFASDSFFV